jgi:hypothetical protein
MSWVLPPLTQSISFPLLHQNYLHQETDLEGLLQVVDIEIEQTNDGLHTFLEYLVIIGIGSIT